MATDQHLLLVYYVSSVIYVKTPHLFFKVPSEACFGDFFQEDLQEASQLATDHATQRSLLEEQLKDLQVRGVSENGRLSGKGRMGRTWKNNTCGVPLLCCQWQFCCLQRKETHIFCKRNHYFACRWILHNITTQPRTICQQEIKTYPVKKQMVAGRKPGGGWPVKEFDWACTSRIFLGSAS